MSTNSTDSDKVVEGCLVSIVALLLMPLSAWWHAFVMLKLWNWFILPIQGAPALTIGNCMGVALIFGLLSYGLASMKEKDKDKSPGELLGGLVAKIIVIPGMLLFFGWLYQMWFMR